MFKSRVSKSTEILFKNSFHFNVLSKDSRVYQLNFNGFDDKIYNIDISKMYSKFFAGCGCRRESF